MVSPFPWWYPAGAQLDEKGAHFRVWAPDRRNLSVIIGDAEYPLSQDTSGYFHGNVPTAQTGEVYGFRVDGHGPFPDPASRFQPQGPHGLSQLIDASKFKWSDKSWKGIELPGQVIYEMHIGTFTQEGMWRSAMERLPELLDLGVTVLEVMPVADFVGTFGWGYDGVNLFAPTRNYGTPDDFRAFVNRAHELNLSVILDVVYNHVGPDGNFLPRYSEAYFAKQHKTDWGEAINFYAENSGPVREYFVSNAAYWIAEFHLDGLRLDATQNIYDESNEHILEVVVREARRAAGSRKIIVVGENEPQQVRLIRSPAQGGYGIDALWNDDFHHSAMVAATGKRGAYYTDYLGNSQELCSAIKYGFLYQGQWYSWQKKRRGTALFGTDPASMINFLQNHDQVANSARGLRLHELTATGTAKALTALFLLAPSTPMIFQGQEFAASAKFLFFADQKPEIAELVRKGRAEFLSQWRNLALGEMGLDDPAARETFEKCILDWSERETHAEVLALHRDLIRLRKSDPIFSRQDRNFDGAVLSRDSFILRFFSQDFRDDRLLVINLGREINFSPSPEPLLAPPANSEWQLLWSSDHPKYGGDSTAPLDSDLNWVIPARCAAALRATPKEEGTTN